MFLVVGLIAFTLGVIGIFLPLLPTTPLFLLTSFCLLKSSDRLNEKFIQTKLYEKYVKSFKEQGGMTLKAKLCLVIPVSLLLLFMFITIDSPIMRGVIVVMWLLKVIVFTKMKTIKIDTKQQVYEG
ncbi:MAG: YbaN family protein [Romboutsia sp.]|nr:YbaN family protein [Romboutsia sp.]